MSTTIDTLKSEISNYMEVKKGHPNFFTHYAEEEGFEETVRNVGNGSGEMNSLTYPTNDLFPDLPQELTRFATVCCITFILLGIPGNLLTIVALARCKKVHSATAYFIINLSICDLMFCCFNLPLATSMFWNRRWIHGETLCILFPFFRYGLMAVSIFTVLAITINRYIMIGHPRLYPRLYDSFYLCVMIGLIWLGAFAAIIPTLFGAWGKFELDETIGSCSIVKDNRKHSPKTFLFLVAFVLPCCAIIVCYARIFCIVHQATVNSRPMENTTGSAKSIRARGNVVIEPSSSDQASTMLRGQSDSKRPSAPAIHQRGKMTSKDKKLLWMILVIFGMFLICHLPITIQKLLTEQNSFWNIIGLILIYSTTCLNPIIYVIMSQEYRQAYKGLIFCTTDWNINSRSHFQSATYHQATEHSSQKSHTSQKSQTSHNNVQTDDSKIPTTLNLD